MVNDLQLNTTSIVLELTEQQPLSDFEAIRAAAGELRAAGFRLALDDLGAGHAGLRAWSEIKPEYVKIDRHFIQNIHEDAVKRDFVRSIQAMGRDLGCRVVAEGIEVQAELDVVRQLGIAYVQGYLLGMPKASPSIGVPGAIAASAAPPRQFLSGVSAAEIAQSCFIIAPEMLTEQVLDLLLSDPGLAAVPVIESDGRPLGLVLRHELADRFSARYRRELYGRKPIRQFMRSDFIGVEETVGLEEISRQLTSTVGQDLPQVFLVTRQGRFTGVGRTQTLLRLLTELQIRNASHANPLTQLPGNVPICEQIDRLLATATDFYVAYFDINNFKPFNDAFGFARGDEVLRMTAEIIRRHCAEPDQDFVGHIGGDDFVVLFRANVGAACCRAIQADFDREIQRYYSAEALASGGMHGEDRQGRTVFHPIAGLAIGLGHPDPALCSSHHEVSTLAMMAKHEAKKRPGSALFVCRRHGPPTAKFTGVESVAMDMAEG